MRKCSILTSNFVQVNHPFVLRLYCESYIHFRVHCSSFFLQGIGHEYYFKWNSHLICVCVCVCVCAHVLCVRVNETKVE